MGKDVGVWIWRGVVGILISLLWWVFTDARGNLEARIAKNEVRIEDSRAQQTATSSRVVALETQRMADKEQLNRIERKLDDLLDRQVRR